MSLLQVAPASGASEFDDAWCPDTMRESDWLLSLDHLGEYLAWIAASFEAGLGEDDIAAAVDLARRLAPGHAAQVYCDVTIGGHVASLRLNLLAEAGGQLTIGLCTEPRLSEQLDWTVERFYDELAGE